MRHHSLRRRPGDGDGEGDDGGDGDEGTASSFGGDGDGEEGVSLEVLSSSFPPALTGSVMLVP